MDKVRVEINTYRFWWKRLGLSTRRVSDACGVSHVFAWQVFRGSRREVPPEFLQRYRDLVIRTIPSKINVTDFINTRQVGGDAQIKDAQGSDSSLSVYNHNNNSRDSVKEKVRG